MIFVTVSEEQAAYAEEMKILMLNEELRAEVDIRNESMGYKVRDAISKKVPYVCVIGAKEQAEGKVSVRRRGEEKSVIMSNLEFIEMVKSEITQKI
jgi:threonyl-tRNA synthetase